MSKAKSEFDANAVLLVLVGGRSFFEAAQELGISELKLRRWVREAERTMQHHDSFLDVLAELAELQREKQQLLSECKNLRNERALLTEWRSRDTTET